MALSVKHHQSRHLPMPGSAIRHPSSTARPDANATQRNPLRPDNGHKGQHHLSAPYERKGTPVSFAFLQAADRLSTELSGCLSSAIQNIWWHRFGERICPPNRNTTLLKNQSRSRNNLFLFFSKKPVALQNSFSQN